MSAIDETAASAVELSTSRLTLRQVNALVVYTLREALHRWTLITYLVGISIFLLLLATAVSLDIVEGTLASARLFGQDLEIGDMGIRITDVVRVFQVGITSLLYVVGVAFALFLTGNQVPSLAREGWADLLIAQPISRTTLLLGRALGACVVVALGVAYLVCGSWAVLRWKTGFGNAGFLLAGLLILFTFVACYAATVLAGIVTGNGVVAGMLGAFVWLMGHAIYPLHRFPGWRAALPAGWGRNLGVALSEGIYWILPKSQGLGQAAVAAARGEAPAAAPVFYSLPFIAVCLLISCWSFQRRDY